VPTFIERFQTFGTGTTLAVKDVIDMAGVITTAGSKAVAETAGRAKRDAGCLAGARAANVRIVGKTNLQEFALGTTGVNPWYGTPANPADPARIPGGSSSGSAVAVATGEADVAYGTDTGGSIRIPAACCGVAGLKTTWGRVPVTGVWPVAPGLDTVGPMARNVEGLVLGMQLLEPGFQVGKTSRWRIGRVALDAGSQMDAAVDKILRASGLDVAEIRLEGWEPARWTGRNLVTAEAWRQHGGFVQAHRDSVGPAILERFAEAQHLAPNAIEEAQHGQRTWTDELSRALRNFDYLVVPTLRIYAPLIDEVDTQLGATLIANTMPINLAGCPAVALPVPGDGRLPASLQVIGPPGSEEDLLAAAMLFEEVAALQSWPPSPTSRA
jgi:amidase